MRHGKADFIKEKDWSGGNVVYVPLSTGTSMETAIQAAITAAASGDTLVLAAGEWVIDGTITVNKKLHIRGMGRGITTLATAIASPTLVSFTTTDGSLISDLTIDHSGALTSGNVGIVTGSVNYDAKRVEILNKTTGAQFPIGFNQTAAKTTNLFDCRHIGTGSSGSSGWAISAALSGAVVNAYNFYATESGSGRAYIVTSSTTGAIINLFGGYYKSTTSQASGVATSTNAAINVYGSILDGAGASAFDVQGAAGTLYNTTLVNNKTDGTITYGGTVVSGTVRGIHKTQDNTAAVADGDYTVGKGVAADGVLTIKDGLITAITEASDV